MADTVDIDVLHTAIVDSIKAKFPAFRSVEFYREDEEQKFPTPAVVLEMTEIEPADPSEATGTPHTAVDLRFEARVILPRTNKDVKLDTRRLALAFAAWINTRRWRDCPGGPARLIGAIPDAFSANAESFEVWMIEWVQLHFVGDDPDWDDSGIYGEDALYSFVPQIGIPHEPDYEYADGRPRT